MNKRKGCSKGQIKFKGRCRGPADIVSASLTVPQKRFLYRLLGKARGNMQMKETIRDALDLTYDSKGKPIEM